MTAITLSQAQTMLAAYLDAETKILSGQRARMGDRDLTRADLAEVRKGRADWQRTVDALSAAAAGDASPRRSLANWNY